MPIAAAGEPKAMSDLRAKLTGSAAPSIAVAAALALATLVGVVALASSSSEPPVAAAPPRCVSLWNSDTKALIVGYHAYHSHSYQEAQVVRLTDAGEPDRSGSCSVVFPSATLDSEPGAAAKAYRAGRWAPLSQGGQVSAVRLSELQVEALERANATLGPDGTLAPSR